jgi:hypothetical protein
MLRRTLIAAGASVVIITGCQAMGLSVPNLSSARLLNLPGSTPTATAVASKEPSPSGGLGNSRSDLDAAYGSPNGLRGTMLSYAGGTRAVSYVDNKAEGILLTFSASDPPGLPDARKRVTSLLPLDAAFDGTVGAGPHRVADLYHSTRLASIAMPATPTARPGQFVVVFESDPKGAIRTALVAIGSVPRP